MYRLQGGSWTTGTPTYDPARDRWVLVWKIPETADLGLYDVKVVVQDPDGGRAVKKEFEEFEVTLR
jgi:hypothetical protein